MCLGCVDEYLDGSWIDVTPEMREVAALVDSFHEMPGMSVGGFLHCELDDTNIEDIEGDAPVERWREWIGERAEHYLPMETGEDGVLRSRVPSSRSLTPDEREAAIEAATRIWSLMVPMTEAQRAVSLHLDQYEHWRETGLRMAMVEDTVPNGFGASLRWVQQETPGGPMYA